MASDPHHMFPVGPLAQHPYHHSYNTWAAPQTQPISVRQYPSTSSAFSASAHPDEDWTKVSDLAERRRIQNRIAQRNYRKKIKERMQFLESKAAVEDGKGSTKKTSKSSSGTKKAQQAHQRRRSSPPVTAHSNNLNNSNPHNNGAQSLAAPHALHHPFTPPMHPEDQFFPSPSPPASNSPPPFSAFGHSAYSPPSDNGFYTTAPHPAVTTWMSSAALTSTAAPTLPPMNHFSDAAAYAGSGASKGNESMSFASYDYSLGVPTTASPYDSNPHTPPMTHSFDHSCSSDNSEAEWSAYPVTPLSMGSP